MKLPEQDKTVVRIEVAPRTIGLILANDREIMGSRVNSRWTNVFGILITVLVTAAGSAYAIVAFMATFAHKNG